MEFRSPNLNAKQPKTPTHTLIRVRNNQRRHRQRRREYIESLERELESSRQTVTQLESQNQSLLEQLLGQHPHQQGSKGGADMHDLTAVATSIPPSIWGGHLWSTWYSQPYLQPHGIAGTAQITAAAAGVGDFQTWNTHGLSGLSRQANYNAPECAAPEHLSEPPTVNRIWADPAPSQCCSSLPSEPILSGLVTDNPSNVNDPYQTILNHYLAAPTTMLCSRAYPMIQLYNRRGIAMEIVDGWLWPGFIWAGPSNANGCSVDSSLLLQVLSYIAEIVEES